MGKFAENLVHRIRGRRAAKRVKWPTGFKGTVMWCSACTKEIMRIPSGQTAGIAEQHQAVDAHNLVCARAKLRLVEQK